MPQTQLSTRLGSDNSIFGLKETKNVSLSKFDFSKKNFSTIDLGAITPVDCFMVYPRDKIKLSLQYILDTFPLEVPPMNNYYVRTHWYYIKLSALWKGWNTFITRGRSGNIDLTIPSLKYSDVIASVQLSENKFRNYSCPNGLLDYLGFKPKYYNNNPAKPSYLPYLENTSDSFTETGYSSVTSFSALKAFAYQKICRFNYMPSNLLQDNKVWFPDDLEDPWYIDYSASNLDGCYFVPESATMPESDFVANEVPTVQDNVVDLRQLRYALFGDDYFTSAKPWLVRGDEQFEDLDLQGVIPVRFYESLMEQFDSVDSNGGIFAKKSTGNAYISPSNDDSTYQTGLNIYGNGNSTSKTYETPEQLKSSFSHRAGIDLSTAEAKVGLSANMLRNLLALSVWQERNTLCDGSYNRTINVHWNSKPRSPEYTPIYLGGTSDVVQFGKVVQTSTSVDGSPLGTQAGSGGAQNGSQVFSFSADDYGLIMGVMIISPEVIYSQGFEHEDTDLTWDEQFQPEFANLGYQPILNKEIYAQGTTDDDDLFGYQTRYAYLKHRRNTVSGLFDLKPSQDSMFGPYVQARRFNSLPELSAQFVTMSPDNLDRSWLSFSNYPAFKLQFASNVELVRALPYQSTPETFGF